MPSYLTLDYLPDLTYTQAYKAPTLTFSPYIAPPPFDAFGWDNVIRADASTPNDIFKFNAVFGAKYLIQSGGQYDPYNLRIYDAAGNVVVTNSETYDNYFGYNFYDSEEWTAPYTGTFYVDASWNTRLAWGGQDYAFLYIREDLDTAIKWMPSPPPPPPPSIPGIGTPGVFQMKMGTSGDDVFIATLGDDTIYGSAGVDTIIYSQPLVAYTVTAAIGPITVGNSTSDIYVTNKSGVEGPDHLVNVERLHFTDRDLAFDIHGDAGQAYRIYQAAFNRTPDKAGLGYWIDQMDHGMGVPEVSARFIDSPEFRSLYGINPSTGALVDAIYNNVLHRAPDKGGHDFYVNQIDTGQKSLPQVLADFSESPENQAQVIGVIEHGIEFLPFG